MSKNTTPKVVYKVEQLSTTDYKVAAAAAKNLCRELNAAFTTANLSISQFANWLSLQDSESANFVKTSVLKASDKDGIFAAIRGKYPYKDADGKLVRKTTLCKGLQTIEVITNFSDAILSAIIERTYLRNCPAQILPQYFNIDKKSGKITEIDERTAAQMIEADKADKAANKAAKAAKLAKLERIYDELQELAKEAANVNKFNKTELLDYLSRFIELSQS